MSKIAINNVWYDDSTSKYRFSFTNQGADLVNRKLKLKTPLRQQKMSSGLCVTVNSVFQEFTVQSCTGTGWLSTPAFGTNTSTISCTLAPVTYSNSCGTVYENRTINALTIKNGYWV